MKTALEPWLAVVDAFSPNWRRQFHGQLGSSRLIDLNSSKQHKHPSHADVLRLREAVELLGVALIVDGDALLAATPGSGLNTTYSPPFESGARLQLRIWMDTRQYQFGANHSYFLGWSEAASSSEYQETKRKILRLQKKAVYEDEATKTPGRLGLSICVSLDAQIEAGDADIGNLLRTINLNQFDVTNVKLEFGTSACERAALVALFAVVETFRNGGARVKIVLKFPSLWDSFGTISQWKILFDLVTRRCKPQPANSEEAVIVAGDWDLYVECSEIDTIGDSYIDYLLGLSGTNASDARLVVACLSALTHADESVTSVEFHRGLEDDDSYAATRAQSLACILLSGSVETLSVRDKQLEVRHIHAIEEIVSTGSREEQIAQLWVDDWENDEYKPVRQHDIEYLLEYPSDLLHAAINDDHEHVDAGASEHENQHDSSSGQRARSDGKSPDNCQPDAASGAIATDQDSEMTVWLIGCGQCTLPRASVASALKRRPEGPVSGGGRPLKSFSLDLYGDEQQRDPVYRLVRLVGGTLQQLKISTPKLRFPLSFLRTVLQACPQLHELSLPTLEPDSDQTTDETSTRDRHPLKVLTIRLDEASTFPRVLSILDQHGVQLQTLRVLTTTSPTERLNPSGARESSPNDCIALVTVLQVSSLTLSDVWGRTQWRTLGVGGLTSLFIDTASWEPPELLQLLSALSCNDHPLTRSLHTVDITLTRHTQHLVEELFDMVKINRFLVKADLTVPWDESRASEFRNRALETNQMDVQRYESPLSIVSKIAFLSCRDKVAIRWENEAMARVFDFAARAKQRRVRINFAVGGR